MISSLFKGHLGSLYCLLNPWTPEATPMSWVNTSTHQDQAIQQEINPFQECKCARTLGPTEWWSSEGLEPVTLGVWRHLAGLGDRRHLGELLDFVGAPRRRSCTRFETRHSGDGERVFLVDSCSSWCKGAIPFVGAPTWTRGSVNSSIPREKICLVHSHLLSSNLFSYFSALVLCLFVWD